MKRSSPPADAPRLTTRCAIYTRKSTGEGLDQEFNIWVVSPRVIPQLRQMEDTAGHLIWQEDARSGAPATLLGRSVVRNYRSPALGTLGDVLLIVPTYYLIKDGVATTVAASEHVLFKQNKTVVMAFKTVDGGTWLDGPIAQEDGSTYSPFVALDVPA
jgi:HK97 family phage major capsid protein